MASDVSFDRNNSGVQMGNNYGSADIHIHKGTSEATLNQRCLRDLRVTNPQDDKARIESFKGGLLKESYRWILANSQFVKWQRARHQTEDGDNEDNRLLWIKADPGKGKTMLLCGIIDELQKESDDDTALAFFFCQTDEPELRSATCVMRGLIFLLVESRPYLLSHVRRRWDQEGREMFEDKNAWEALSQIFLDILKDRRLQSVTLILDALDECTSGRSRLIDLVKGSSGISKAKWIVSSRDWPEIEEQLLMASCSVLSLEMNQDCIANAVDMFILFKVDWLAKLKKYDPQTREFVKFYLTSNSNETFLWVALVCEELVKTSSWRAEEKLTTLSPGLTNFYQRMIEEIDQSNEAQLCKDILSTTSATYRPLTLDELPIFVTLPSQPSTSHQVIAQIVKLCGSFLSIRGDTIVFIHQSAKDFLLDSHSLFPSGISTAHRKILQVSLGIMDRTLRRDIYCLRHPASRFFDFPLGKSAPPDPDPLGPVRYASVYWIDHLLGCDLKLNRHDVLKETSAIAPFLAQHFLHWLEALCLLRYTWRGIKMMTELDNLLPDEPLITELARFVTDACLFLHRHRTVIERNPLQIYSSSLAFSPDYSLVKRCYEKERASWIIKPPTMEDTWSQCTHTIERSVGLVVALSWSQDGSHIMCVDENSSLQIFNSNTGHFVSSVHLEKSKIAQHNRCLAWSFDRSKVASIGPNKLMIWDCNTGSCLYLVTTDNCKCYRPKSICWSKDGKKIAALRYDGEEMRGKLMVFDISESQRAEVQSIDLPAQGSGGLIWSHHQRWLILVDRYAPAVKIWDRTTWTLIKSFHVPDQPVTNFTLGFAYFESPATQLLATAAYDVSGEIWNLHTGERHCQLNGHYGQGDTKRLDWSPDGKWLVTSSEDQGLRLWDPVTGDCLYKLTGSTYATSSKLCWSPDSKRLASSSSTRPGTVRIWEPELTSNLSTTDLTHGPVLRIYWSPDGVQLAIVYRFEVQIWNIALNTLLSSFEFGESFLDRPVISWRPDGIFLALASGTQIIQIRHILNGECMQQLSHGWVVDSIAWSSDGSRIASASYDGLMVRVWYLATQNSVGLKHRASRGHRDMDDEISFLPLSWSPDDKQIASACCDHIIIFDPVTGEITQILWQSKDFRYHAPDSNRFYIVHSMAWSPHGGQFASASPGCIMVWNTVTGECLQKIVSGSLFVQFDRLSPHLLKTTWGTIDMDAIGNQDEEEDEEDEDKLGYSPFEDVVTVGYGLYRDYSWITWQGCPLLWLPVECRPYDHSSFDISGEKVTIGTASGHVLVLWLAPDPTSMFG